MTSIQSTILLVWELAKRDFVDRFAGSILGFFWTIIWPVVNLAIYIIIFGELMGARLPGAEAGRAGYGIYLSAGILPWTAFASVVSRSTTIFLDKAHLIKKVPMVLWTLPLYIVVSESIVFFIAFFIFFCALLFLNNIGPIIAICLLYYYLAMILAAGLGLFLGTLTVFLRDIKEFVGILLQLWFWFTPIVYVKEILPSLAQKMLYFNPMYYIVSAIQQVVLKKHVVFDWNMVALFFTLHIFWLFSIWLNQKLSRDVRDMI